MNETSGETSSINRRVIQLRLRFNITRQNGSHAQLAPSEPVPLPPPVALLIDGENILSSHLIPQMLEVASRLGNVTIRRVYGNWRNNPFDGHWRQAAIKYGLQPMHSIKGKETEKKESGKNGNDWEKHKNGSDISLVIGALDLLHYSSIRHFCIVTGDSDYLPLITRLREAGCTIVGIGNPQTQQSLRLAYDSFLTTDDLIRSNTALQEPKPPANPILNGNAEAAIDLPKPALAEPVTNHAEETLDQLLISAYQDCLENKKKYKDLPENEKWVYFPDVGDSLQKLNKDYKKIYEIEFGWKNAYKYIKTRTDLFEWRVSKSPPQIDIKLRKR
ncbi:MAG TPA: NYN domain-containing protein [Ktedonobacteraceae bacterium]|nr:NYN domain-containing protein [Ktedonobacteraceae bacterium]